MRYDKNRHSPPSKFGDAVQTFALKSEVADRQYFIDKQNFGICKCSDGKAKPHLHATAICPERAVDKGAEFGEFDHVIKAVKHLTARQPSNYTRNHYVLTA